MTQQETAFALLRAALEGSAPAIDAQALDTAGWWGLFRLLQRNHVSALCFEAAVAAGVPRDVRLPWLAEREKVAARYRFQEGVQRQIVDTMAAHGIDTLVLKGTHLAQYYPVAEVREFGDLDLYFYDRHDEADDIARRELRVGIDSHSHHHTRYELRGVTVESHFDFVNIHYPPSNRRYEALLKELAPSPTFEVLFLLRHMACHFAASRITMRDLADWTLTCRAMRDLADWELVRRTAGDYGMTPFLSALDAVEGNERFASSVVYGDIDDHEAENAGRLLWKLRRWRANAWKRRMVFSDSPAALLLSSLTSHGLKPQSILHKM